MAINSTIFKVDLQIADMNRHYYHDHLLILARHPSETDERMMVRLLAFSLHAHDYLEFGQGITNEDEADLWQKALSGVITLWVDVGMPDEKLIRKACSRAKQVIVYCYGGRVVDTWFSQNSTQLARLKNLTVINIPLESTRAIAKMAQRKMQLNCTIQEEQIWLNDGNDNVLIELLTMKESLMFIKN